MYSLARELQTNPAHRMQCADTSGMQTEPDATGTQGISLGHSLHAALLLDEPMGWLRG